ncbi:MAG: hypothetical protein ACKOW9_05530 [Candidatus Paceibacterota bacterium]
MNIHPLLLSLAATAYSKSNPEASLAAQQSLLNTKNKFILTALSLNPNLHISIFTQLLQHPSKKIISNLLSRKLTEEQLQEVLKLDLTDTQVSKLVESDNITEERASSLNPAPKTSTSILENTTLSYELRRKHISSASLKAQLILMGDHPEKFTNQEISDHILVSDQLPAKKYPRLPLARLFHKKPDLIDLLTADHPEPVITTAASSPYITSLPRQKNLLDIIIKNSYQYALMALTANPRFQQNLIDELPENQKNSAFTLTYASKKTKRNPDLLNADYSTLTDTKTLSYLLKRALPGEYSLTGKIIDSLLLARNPLLKDDLTSHLRFLATEHPYLKKEIQEILNSEDVTLPDYDQEDNNFTHPSALLNTAIVYIKDIDITSSELIINLIGNDLKHWENFITLLPDYQLDVSALIQACKTL